MGITLKQLRKLDPVAASAITGRRRRVKRVREIVAEPAFDGIGFCITVAELPSPNTRWHPMRKRAVCRAMRESALVQATALGRNRFWPGYRVRMTWHGSKMDADNVTAGMKWAQDGIATASGVDDGDPRWEWEPRQAPPVNGWRGVRVEFLSVTRAREVAERLIVPIANECGFLLSLDSLEAMVKNAMNENCVDTAGESCHTSPHHTPKIKSNSPKCEPRPGV